MGEGWAGGVESAKQAFPPNHSTKGPAAFSTFVGLHVHGHSLSFPSSSWIRVAIFPATAWDSQDLSTSGGPQLTSAKPITSYKASSYTRSFGLTEPRRGRDFQYLPRLKGEFNAAHFDTDLLSINFHLAFMVVLNYIVSALRELIAWWTKHSLACWCVVALPSSGIATNACRKNHSF